MEIFSNWIFWVVLASIVFVLALIGYLTESMKNSKKNDRDEEVSKSEEPISETPMQSESVTVENQVSTDDWMNMPKINKPLEEVKVDTINDVQSSTPDTSVDVASSSETNNIFDNSADNDVESITHVTNDTTEKTQSSVNMVETSTPETSSVFNNSVNNDVVSSTPVINENSANGQSSVNMGNASSVETSNNMAAPEVPSSTPDVQPIVPSAPVEDVNVETLNTSDSTEKNNDIWNL